MNTEQLRAELLPCPFCGGRAKEYDRFNANTVTCLGCGVKVRQSEMGQGDASDRWNRRAALQSQDREGWKEAAIAWEVCASIHREYCKGKDPFFKTRQADFVKHAEASREKALGPCSAEDKTDAERYRWLRNSAGFLALPYVDHGAGPEFPSGSELDEAIDHARRVEGDGE